VRDGGLVVWTRLSHWFIRWRSHWNVEGEVFDETLVFWNALEGVGGGQYP
jgi:hypothetical protein